MALFDVIIASVILMLVFLPLSTLLIETTAVVGSYRQTVVGESVGAGQLADVRAMATSASNWTGTPSVLTSLPSNGSTTVSGIPFNYKFQGGWCAVVSGVLTNGTPSPSTNPYVYYVKVSVSWAAQSSRPGSVNVGSEISPVTSNGIFIPVNQPTGGTTNCPVSP
jgi:hypothetical protein